MKKQAGSLSYVFLFGSLLLYNALVVGGWWLVAIVLVCFKKAKS